MLIEIGLSFKYKWMLTKIRINLLIAAARGVKVSDKIKI